MEHWTSQCVSKRIFIHESASCREKLHATYRALFRLSEAIYFDIYVTLIDAHHTSRPVDLTHAVKCWLGFSGEHPVTFFVRSKLQSSRKKLLRCVLLRVIKESATLCKYVAHAH